MQNVHVDVSLTDSDYEKMCSMAQVLSAAGGAPFTPDDVFGSLLSCYLRVDGVDLISDMVKAVSSQRLDFDGPAE